MRSHLRVLVVEDDPRILALIVDVLTGVATVHGAPDVEEAHRLLTTQRGRRYDLAIVDCLLPGPQGVPSARGVELIAGLRRDRPAMPILAITGASSAAVVVDAFRSGARDVLRKPFAVDDLRAAVTRLTLRPGRRAPPRTAPSHAGVTRVLTYLAQHPEEPASLDTLARLASMSRSHLSRTFRDEVGVSIRAYVRNLRLEGAQRLLMRSPRTSLTDIAIDAGFYDLPHFDKAFRARFGVSPTEFLRRRDPPHEEDPPKRLRHGA
jgi:AraC-like DNA-binding protein